MDKPLVIDYYSDVLCVWAWIAQPRIDELHAQLGSDIELRYHYVDIFGDVAGKIQRQWAERGLYQGFAKHVVTAAADFEQTPVNPDVWCKCKPTTSANAHLMLKAVELTYDRGSSIRFALEIRQAFFLHAQDISDFGQLYLLAEKEGLDIDRIKVAVNSGAAMAAMMSDYQKANRQGIKGSPSYVMDGGRQTLYGNVGYRVLQANVEELLKSPTDEASWC